MGQVVGMLGQVVGMSVDVGRFILSEEVGRDQA